MILHVHFLNVETMWKSYAINLSVIYVPQVLITDRKGKVMFSQVFVCPQSASWLFIHCSALLRLGQYASYWNAFFFDRESEVVLKSGRNFNL